MRQVGHIAPASTAESRYPSLTHSSGVKAAGPRAGVLGFFVATTGHVVFEQATFRRGSCRTRRRSARRPGPAWRPGRLPRIIWPSWFALPSRLNGATLDLLVVLQLELEETSPSRWRGRPRPRWLRRCDDRPGNTFSSAAMARSGCPRWRGDHQPGALRPGTARPRRWCRGGTLWVPGARLSSATPGSSKPVRLQQLGEARTRGRPGPGRAAGSLDTLLGARVGHCPPFWM